MKRVVVTFIQPRWETILAWVILLSLGLFLIGHDLFGLRGWVAMGLGVIGALVLPIALFVFGTMILPLVTMVTLFFGALFAMVVAPVVAFVMGAIIIPLTAFLTGLISMLLTWLAGTWLGMTLMPVINLISPLLLKFGPWLAAMRHSEWAMGKIAKLRRTLRPKRPRKPIRAIEIVKKHNPYHKPGGL